MKWFTSYLIDRQQYVSVNGHCSNYLNITYGVPQGSVLGPLLFLIYINDLPNSTKVLTFYLFADDTNIYFESSDLIVLLIVPNCNCRAHSQLLVMKVFMVKSDLNLCAQNYTVCYVLAQFTVVNSFMAHLYAYMLQCSS